MHNELIRQKLKAEVYEIRHEVEILELKLKNRLETIELKLDRIDRIDEGDNDE